MSSVCVLLTVRAQSNLCALPDGGATLRSTPLDAMWAHLDKMPHEIAGIQLRPVIATLRKRAGLATAASAGAVASGAAAQSMLMSLPTPLQVTQKVTA